MAFFTFPENTPESHFFKEMPWVKPPHFACLHMIMGAEINKKIDLLNYLGYIRQFTALCACLSPTCCTIFWGLELIFFPNIRFNIKYRAYFILFRDPKRNFHYIFETEIANFKIFSNRFWWKSVSVWKHNLKYSKQKQTENRNHWQTCSIPSPEPVPYAVFLLMCPTHTQYFVHNFWSISRLHQIMSKISMVCSRNLQTIPITNGSKVMSKILNILYFYDFWEIIHIVPCVKWPIF